MNIKKTIIGGIMMLIIGLGNFGYHNNIIENESIFNLQAHAQPVTDPNQYAQQLAANAAPDASTNKALNDLASLLDIILNVLYIIIRPLLAITGMALDNSLVYGEAFGLTTTLRKFWTIMMQISYIILTIMILRDIVKLIWEKNGDMYKDLPNKIKSWLLAGVLIPLSWFIVSALIDLSTILIYQVGSIPLTLISQNDDTKILVNSSIINLSDRAASTEEKDTNFRFNTSFSCSATPNKTYLPCQFEDDSVKESSWNKYINQEKAKYAGEGQSNNGLAQAIENGKGFCALSPTALIKVEYNKDISSQTGLSALLQAGSVEMSGCDTIGDLITKSKSMVGPLYTIYGSLLNFTSLNVTVSAKSTETEVMLFLIKAVTGMLLVIPLIALAFVSIARIGILWMVIAFSPLLILNKIFGGKGISGDISKNLESNWLEMVNFKTGTKQILDIIFQPVIVVLALGLSIVFLNATNNMLKYSSDKAGLLDAIGINIDSDKEYQTFSVHNEGGKTTDIKIKKFSAEYSTSIFFDYFSRIIANIFGIMIMWKLMFMALGAADMTKNITSKVQSFGEDYLSSRPIFPGPNGSLSRDSVKSVAGGVTGEIGKRFTKDKTEDAAKELVDYTKASFGGPGYDKHNKEISLDKTFDTSSSENQSQMAADTMAGGIAKIGSENKNFRYINKKDVAGWDKITSNNGLNVTGDSLSEIVTQDNFWNGIIKSKDSQAALSTMKEALTKDDVAKNLVGTKNIGTLRVNINKGIKQLTEGGVSSADNNSTIKADNNNLFFYTTKTDTQNNTYSLEQAFAVNKASITDQYQEMNNFVKGEKALHDKVKDYFGISNLDDAKDGGIYSDGTKFAIKNTGTAPVTPPTN